MEKMQITILVRKIDVASSANPASDCSHLDPYQFQGSFLNQHLNNIVSTTQQQNFVVDKSE